VPGYQTWDKITYIMFDYHSRPSNPLTAFLEASAKLLDIAGGENIRPEDYSAFTRNSEERNYWADLCDRVHRIAFAFDRLCELTDVHHEAAKEMKKRLDEADAVQLSAEMLQADGRWHVETDVLTFYIYYELKSGTDMLKKQEIAPGGSSELEYALKARDRFLAHPEFCRVAPRANRAKSIPARGFTRCEIASLRQWDSVTQNVYLAKLNMSEPIDREAEVRRNSEMILRKQRNEELSEQDVVRIKAFGVREPDLEKAIEELAALLDSGTLPKIASACAEAINRFGFEQIPDGPRFVYRLWSANHS
jgi:hypothetical protein